MADWRVVGKFGVELSVFIKLAPYLPGMRRNAQSDQQQWQKHVLS
jgi:hypothetical protein